MWSPVLRTSTHLVTVNPPINFASNKVFYKSPVVVRATRLIFITHTVVLTVNIDACVCVYILTTVTDASAADVWLLAGQTTLHTFLEQTIPVFALATLSSHRPRRPSR